MFGAVYVIDVVIPAHNEERTIADVVRAARGAAGVGQVIVVDDGSKDGTAQLAAFAGAFVLRAPVNHGKGQAMRAGFEWTRSHGVCFLDSDLLGLESRHVERLVRIFVRDCPDMVCGLRDYGAVQNAYQWLRMGEIITGERVVMRDILERVPSEFWTGYAIETAINCVCERVGGRVVCEVMPGVSPVSRREKLGEFVGSLAIAKMFGEMGRTRKALERYDFPELERVVVR